jgi:hypothetical protein
MLVFVVFVLPSALYRKQFTQSLNSWRQWIRQSRISSVFRVNFPIYSELSPCDYNDNVSERKFQKIVFIEKDSNK